MHALFEPLEEEPVVEVMVVVALNESVAITPDKKRANEVYLGIYNNH